MLYKKQNDECSTELEDDNQGIRLLTTVDTYWFEETVTFFFISLCN